ncbi:hypothetical protein Tco_0823699 [Tanacetum coccineum]|uniref:Uncharacterized protein n=1 Tax=Tanacetum coccineum TaxID=301880 RepID=A0ABQ5AIN2_9ASTR
MADETPSRSVDRTNHFDDKKQHVVEEPIEITDRGKLNQFEAKRSLLGTRFNGTPREFQSLLEREDHFRKNTHICSQDQKKGFGFAYVKVTMEVAWCKQNVCMMFDLLGCQGAACCTAKVHEGTDEVLEGTAQEYESTAGANLSTAEEYEFNVVDSTRYKTQVLEISTSSSNSLYSVFFISDHYIEPTEFEIQEMVNMIVIQGNLLLNV